MNTQEIQDYKGICGKEIIKGGFGCTCLLPLNHIGECKNSPFVIDEYGNKVEPITDDWYDNKIRELRGKIYMEHARNILDEIISQKLKEQKAQLEMQRIPVVRTAQDYAIVSWGEISYKVFPNGNIKKL